MQRESRTSEYHRQIGAFNVDYDFGFMLYVVACVPERLSECTHPVESRSQEFHWTGSCSRTAALRLYSAPRPPSTRAGCGLGAGYRAAPKNEFGVFFFSPSRGVE